MKKSPSRSRETAEMLAIAALAFIAEEPERLNGFLSVTGIPLEGIREAASQTGFLAGVLEHMLGDESLLLAFADSAGIDPKDIAQARSALGGPRESHLP
jgi:hypothetical protein